MHLYIWKTAMNFWDQNISTWGYKILKQIINPQWSNSKFISTSQLNYPAPWVILLVQEPYLWYVNLYCINLGYKIHTTILKNHMKTTLDAIIGENQSAAIKSRTILQTFSTIRDVIDVSHNLNSSLAGTYLNFCEPFMGYVWILCPS